MRTLRFLVAVALGVAASCGPTPSEWSTREASAAVSVALSLDELVIHSRAAVVATARERESRWEELGGGRRIVTYTRLEVSETVFGPKEKTIWLRTLGGAVDRIGQQVSGEAQLVIGKRSLLFVGAGDDGVLAVTGMAQGHFPIEEADAEKGTPARLRASPVIGKVLRRPGPTISAHEELLGPDLTEALSRVRKAKARVDARAP